MSANTDRTYLDTNSEYEILTYYVRNKEFLKNFEPKRNKEFYTIRKQKELIVSDNELMGLDRTYRFWIRLKKNNMLIGTVSISSIVKKHFSQLF